MSFANKMFSTKMLTVSIIVIFCLVSSFNALLTTTKTLEGMKTSLLSKISYGQTPKMIEIKETISQLIELSKQDKFEQYQRTSFDILITKVRELVDDMLQEQRDEDIQFRNVTNLLMKYHLRQTHALEIVQDKFQLMKYFVEFVNSIDESEGRIDVKTDYSKLVGVLLVIQAKYREYAEVQKTFSKGFSHIYDGLKKSSDELSELIKNNSNPYLSEEMTKLTNQLTGLRLSLQVIQKDNYNYNTNPDLEINMINKYVDYFRNQMSNETRTITPHFFPSFEAEEKQAKTEIQSLAVILDQAEQAMKLTTDSLNSNYQEYQTNKKSRKEIIDVIYQILELCNKRAKRIKGYQLAYIEEIRKKMNGKDDDYEFTAYKKYVFKEPPAKEILSRNIPKLPKDLDGLEDENAQAPVLKEHTKIVGVNNATVTF